MHLRGIYVLLAAAALLGASLAQQRSTPTQGSAARLTPRPFTGTQGVLHPTAKELTRDQMEHFLETARVVGEKPIGEGITKTRRLTLTDGRWIHDAHVQTIDVFKPEFRVNNVIEKNFRDSWKFNVAAYRLDKLMNWGYIPATVERVVDGKPSSVSWWVDGVQFDEAGRRAKNAAPPDLNVWSNQLNDIRDFDALIWNEDRNQGNVLIDGDWKVWAIDHTRAFRDYTTLRDPSILHRISAGLLNGMKNLSRSELQGALMPYVTEKDIDTMLVRRDVLVKLFANRIREKGVDTVVTDLPRVTPKVTIQ